MKVTPRNIARFWKHLMFPPDTEQYHYNRMVLKYDMPWEPWLHCAVWLSIIYILLRGERGVIPPIDGLDWPWIISGLLFPVIGFFSVWVLHHKTGRPRYFGLWGRMIADFGLATTILLYQLDRYLTHSELADRFIGYGVLPNVVLMFAGWFTLTLVWRDLRFIVATERLASKIQCGLVPRWGDDAVR